ncbi:hypothetical protein SK069_09725 [Patulibacter brassicae]|uniref:Uncharacterized protein n=1 Tax=Patulibacter brassicae TaxID=1705717 RepID=A0ABU4VJ60_9ACTN|nr:hypothetical protein [Patulibacter brassicae]MDX8151871.1 hypothetical protein [Patulibacter brassicae]
MSKPGRRARHPVESLMRQCVHLGEMPDREDIAALNLPVEQRAEFRDAMHEALKIRSTGARGKADVFAHERAHEIIDSLPAALQHPGANHRDPLADVHDPAGLAAAVAAVRGY